jgi:PAS domain S-box-containing protein
MEAAAGIYSRIMFPGSVSEADPHLSDLQKAMLDATPDCIKVVSVDGNLLTMNRAGCVALNMPEDSGFGMPWLSLLPEDVQPAGMDALCRAAAGQTARFTGKSHSPSGTIYWDNLLTPLVDDRGLVLSILCVSRDVTEKTLLERKLEEAVDREKLLAREMRHRIKNLSLSWER